MSGKYLTPKQKLWLEYYKKRIEKEIKDNEIKLLGQIEVSDEEYESILLYARSEVSSYYRVDACANPDLLMSIALVQFAIRGYDGKFWEGFFHEAGSFYDSSSANYFGRVFNKTLSFYNLMKLRSEYDKEQYVENIKAHAFVTNNYLEGFFEFADAFYENNLFRCLPKIEDDIIEDISDLSLFMEESLSGNSDSIRSGSHSAAKSYKLLKSTRRVFAQCDPFTINGFFYPILKMLDQYLYDDYLPDNSNNRFAVAFSDWEKRKYGQNSYINREYRTRSLYSRRPFLKFSYFDEMVLLNIPAQRFRKTECEGTVFVEVEINGIKEKKELYLRDSFGTYISSSTQIPVPCAFDEIKVSFNGVEEKNYTIKKRDYRIISRLWESMDKLAEGINEILIKKGTTLILNEHCKIVSKDTDYVNWDHYSIKIDSESALQIGKQTLSLAGEYAKEPIFENEVKEYRLLDKNGNQITATKAHPILSFEVEKERINGTIIKVNEKKISCREIKKSVLELIDRKNVCAVTIDLNDVLDKHDQKYCISYNVPGVGEKRICEYVLLSQLLCKADREMYIKKEYAYIHIRTNVHDVFGQDGWIAIGGDTNYSIEVPITPDLEEITLELDLYGDEAQGYDIKMPLNVFSYGFTEGERIITVNKDDYHWYSDITDNLYVRNKWASSVVCYYEEEKWNLYQGIEIAPGVFKTDISKIRERINSDIEKKNHHIRVSFNGNLERRVFIADILRSTLVVPCFKLQAIDGRIVMPVEKIVGDAAPSIDVKNSHTGELIIENRIIEKGNNYLDELSMNTPYDITLYMEEGDEFGLFSQRTALFNKNRVQCVNIDLNNLYGTSIILEKLCESDKRLPLKKGYFIAPIKKVSGTEYLCKLQEVEMTLKGPDWSTKKPLQLCKLHIEEYGETCRATILCKATDSDGREQWEPFFYDVREKIIVRSDNPILYHSKEYDRFIELDSDEFYITFEKRKIRKVNHAV